MTFSDIPLVVDSGLWYGQHNPSSEWRFHRDIYRNRPDIGAVVHTHSQCATALASTGEGIPAFHYMVAVAGGADIRCAPYATFGSQELSDYAVEALTDRKACLLSNHGVIALGDTLERALSLAGEVENLAALYLAACQFGKPTILNQVEMERVLKKFRTYGRNEVSGDDGDFKFAGKDIPKNAPKS